MSWIIDYFRGTPREPTAESVPVVANTEAGSCSVAPLDAATKPQPYDSPKSGSMPTFSDSRPLHTSKPCENQLQVPSTPVPIREASPMTISVGPMESWQDMSVALDQLSGHDGEHHLGQTLCVARSHDSRASSDVEELMDSTIGNDSMPEDLPVSVQPSSQHQTQSNPLSVAPVPHTITIEHRADSANPVDDLIRQVAQINEKYDGKIQLVVNVNQQITVHHGAVTYGSLPTSANTSQTNLNSNSGNVTLPSPNAASKPPTGRRTYDELKTEYTAEMEKLFDDSLTEKDRATLNARIEKLAEALEDTPEHRKMQAEKKKEWIKLHSEKNKEAYEAIHLLGKENAKLSNATLKKLLFEEKDNVLQTHVSDLNHITGSLESFTFEEVRALSHHVPDDGKTKGPLAELRAKVMEVLDAKYAASLEPPKAKPKPRATPLANASIRAPSSSGTIMASAELKQLLESRASVQKRPAERQNSEKSAAFKEALAKVGPVLMSQHSKQQSEQVKTPTRTGPIKRGGAKPPPVSSNASSISPNPSPSESRINTNDNVISASQSVNPSPIPTSTVADANPTPSQNCLAPDQPV